MNKIKCDCGYRVDPVSGQPKPLITGKGAIKNYITCPRCGITMIAYKTTSGNFARSKKREEIEKQPASTSGVDWKWLFRRE